MSQRILDVGLAAAWQQVGRMDHGAFLARGGDYDDGPPARGGVTPIVAIEGLDGAGKSTVVAELASRMGWPVEACPLREFAAMRAVADAFPDAERRAWYFDAARRSVGDWARMAFGGVPVVIDRSPITTAAYGAAERGTVATARDIPREVTTPDLVFYLDVSEHTRRERLRGRSSLTGEEGRLETDHAFRERVVDGYRRLCTHVIDAERPLDEIIAEIVKLTCQGASLGWSAGRDASSGSANPARGLRVVQS